MTDENNSSASAVKSDKMQKFAPQGYGSSPMTDRHGQVCAKVENPVFFNFNTPRLRAGSKIT